MKYMGSKSRIAKHILPIILQGRTDNQWYVEPFVGGANLIDKVTGNRIGADIHPHLILALKLIRDNPDSIPPIITEDYYAKLKCERKLDAITGFAGFAMSFGGKWFDGYRRDKRGSKGCIENMAAQTRGARNSAIKQSHGLQGVYLVHSSYDKLALPKNSIIYCDPPYKGKRKYKNQFDSDRFFAWCVSTARSGHSVYVSEYEAPANFACVWEKQVSVSISTSNVTNATEKLFKVTA